MNGKNIIEKLNWRYAVKKFDPAKKVSAEDWAVLEESLVLAPSSFGLQPYKFIVVTDQKMKEMLRPAAWGQSQITDCSHLVVAAYKKVITDSDVEKFADLVALERGVGRETVVDYENVIKGSAKKAETEGTAETWNSGQTYIALGFLLKRPRCWKSTRVPWRVSTQSSLTKFWALTIIRRSHFARLGTATKATTGLHRCARCGFQESS
jgi:Nitroreductase family